MVGSAPGVTGTLLQPHASLHTRERERERERESEGGRVGAERGREGRQGEKNWPAVSRVHRPLPLRGFEELRALSEQLAVTDKWPRGARSFAYLCMMLKQSARGYSAYMVNYYTSLILDNVSLPGTTLKDVFARK